MLKVHSSPNTQFSNAMHRKKLLTLLEAHTPADATEEAMLQNTIQFVNQHPDCFERTLLVGHITGSAWIVDKTRTMTVLVHHRKLNRWFQPGGHCDGDSDVLNVAMKEAQEETGLFVKPVDNRIFDVDVHLIPERKNEPAHYHYDIRFMLEADPMQAFQISTESKELRWVSLENVLMLNNSESIMRMARK